jgi:NADH-quinone oxidoreductase subunit F
VVYRREKGDMPANASEIFESEAEKINYHFLAAPHEIIADEKGKVKALKVEIMSGGSIDISGRRRPVSTGKYQEIPCDSIIMAVGERVDSEQLANAGWATTKDGRLIVDPFTFQTSDPKLYAGGDTVTGPSTAAEAMGMAKKAAAAIDFALMKEKRFHLLFREFQYKHQIPLHPKVSHKNKSGKLSVKERIGNFQEVEVGYTGEQARNEVERCLRCDVRC